MATVKDMRHTADLLIAQALRSRPVEWPVDGDADGFGKTFIERAGYHGAIGLLNAANETIALWPTSVRRELREQAFAAAAWEMRHRSYINEVTIRLAEKQICAVILKGTALAYDLYAQPAHRSRSDTDLLVEKHNVDAVRQEFSALGFARGTSADGPFGEIHLQEGWTRICPSGVEHLIDLHWQTMNAPALEGALTFADCLDDPVRLPRLGPAAMAMGHPAMLLHACLHRASHLSAPYHYEGIAYFGGDRLIWLYDIKLLAKALSDAEWHKFVRLAQVRGAAGLCGECLALAIGRLDVQIPREVIAQLTASATGGADRYLLGMRRLERGIANLKAVRGVRAKLNHVAARAFPSERFMRAKYPGNRHIPLPLLYFRRLIRGFTSKLWTR